MADRAAILFCLFPSAYVFTLAYAEGLAVTLAAACLLALFKRHWLLAGTLAMLATVTRPNALALALACAVAAGVYIWQERSWRSLRALVAPALAPLGFVGYLVFLQINLGDWTLWRQLQKDVWQQELDFSRDFVFEELPQWQEHLGNRNWQFWDPMLGLVIIIVSLLLMWRWRAPLILWAYTGGVLFFSLAYSQVGTRTRFLLMAFPLVMAIAVHLRGRWNVYALALAASAGLLVLFTSQALVEGPGSIVP